MDCIYLDANASTPLLPAVSEAMRPHLEGVPGNPASAHGFGRRARQALEDARDRVAFLLGASPAEVVFTSGATEANNLALIGLAGDPPGHLIASTIEHPSVLEPLRQLSRRGFHLDLLPVLPTGIIHPEALASLCRPDTRLAAVLLVNHETGAIQPVRDLARQVPEPCALHCDAAQAVGKLPLNFQDLGVTTLALSAHKLHGPPGSGALLVRRGTPLRPLLHGGHQQRGLRPGSEPVALAVGLATALALAVEERTQRLTHVERLRSTLLDHLQRHAAPVVVNSPPDALPYTLNLSFPGLAADTLLIALDLAGIACSAGSACSSGSLLPSPVLRAMAVPEDVLRSAVRLSFHAGLTGAEVAEAARRISSVVNRLRDPRWTAGGFSPH